MPALMRRPMRGLMRGLMRGPMRGPMRTPLRATARRQRSTARQTPPPQAQGWWWPSWGEVPAELVRWWAVLPAPARAAVAALVAWALRPWATRSPPRCPAVQHRVLPRAAGRRVHAQRHPSAATRRHPPGRWARGAAPFRPRPAFAGPARSHSPRPTRPRPGVPCRPAHCPAAAPARRAAAPPAAGSGPARAAAWAGPSTGCGARPWTVQARA